MTQGNLQRTLSFNEYIAHALKPVFRPGALVHGQTTLLADVLTFAYQPVNILRQYLQPIAEIDSAWLYGPWAARLAGETNCDPTSIHVLVVMDREQMIDVSHAVGAAEKVLGRDVVVRTMTTNEWAAHQHLLSRHLHERPRMRLI